VLQWLACYGQPVTMARIAAKSTQYQTNTVKVLIYQCLSVACTGAQVLM
jgi:hypothetical protein